MKKQQFNRKFNIPDSDLYVLCLEKIRCAHRDQEYFIQYGYDAERLKRFVNQCERFKSLPDDDELVGEQMIFTAKKNEAAESLKAAIRSLMTRVEIKYSNRTGRYRKFGTAKMGDMTDAQLLFCGRRVIRVARAQIDFLAEVGVNENILGRIQEAATQFEQALNLQQDKIADRDIAVENRSDMGNKLYEELLVLCNIGKDIWNNRNTALYENYVLYESNNASKIALKQRRQQSSADSTGETHINK